MSKNKYTPSHKKSKQGIVTRSQSSGTHSLRSREIMKLDDNGPLVNAKRKISSNDGQPFKKSKQNDQGVTAQAIDNPSSDKIESVVEKDCFSCNSTNDLHELSRLLNTDFKAGTNKYIDEIISIRPVPLLQNDAKQRSFGVFATKDITFATTGLNEDHVLVEYIGNKKILSKEAKDRAYTMVLNEGDDVTDPTIISALEMRNWSAMVNSASCAQLANIVIEQVEDNKGEPHIVYLLERPIKKGEQLLVYYGEDYSFDNKLFLNPNDSWHETREQWLEHQDYYHNALLFGASYALPNIDKILKDKNSEVVDIAALQYGQNNDFMAQHQQEHYTALHIACSQADLREINKLLVLGANPYRQSSISGHSPLHLAVSSTAPTRTKIKIIQAIEEKAPAAVLLQDNKDNTILHLAVQQKEFELIKYLLQIELPNLDTPQLSDYVNSNNWDYLCCLLAQGDIGLLDKVKEECIKSLEGESDFYEKAIPEVLAHLAQTDVACYKKISGYIKKTYPTLAMLILTVQINKVKTMSANSHTINTSSESLIVSADAAVSNLSDGIDMNVVDLLLNMSGAASVDIQDDNAINLLMNLSQTHNVGILGDKLIDLSSSDGYCNITGIDKTQLKNDGKKISQIEQKRAYLGYLLHNIQTSPLKKWCIERLLIQTREGPNISKLIVELEGIPALLECLNDKLVETDVACLLIAIIANNAPIVNLLSVKNILQLVNIALFTSLTNRHQILNVSARILLKCMREGDNNDVLEALDKLLFCARKDVSTHQGIRNSGGIITLLQCIRFGSVDIIFRSLLVLYTISTFYKENKNEFLGVFASPKEQVDVDLFLKKVIGLDEKSSDTLINGLNAQVNERLQRDGMSQALFNSSIRHRFFGSAVCSSPTAILPANEMDNSINDAIFNPDSTKK